MIAALNDITWAHERGTWRIEIDADFIDIVAFEESPYAFNLWKIIFFIDSPPDLTPVRPTPFYPFGHVTMIRCRDLIHNRPITE